jgi:hypothetical protein
MASTSSDTKYFGFLPQEAVPGALLVAAAIAAMIVVNSPLAGHYHAILDTSVTVGPSDGGIEMKFSYWIKNGLMAIFFFFVGLELKRELLEGQLSNPAAATLPIVSAAGGMGVPALIFLFFAAPAGFAGRLVALPARGRWMAAIGLAALVAVLVALTLAGRSAEVAYLGIGQLGVQPELYIRQYWNETVRAVGARRVVLIHWDDFFRPLDAPLRALPYAGDDLDVTMRVLTALAERDGVALHLPSLWQRADPWSPQRLRG